MYNLAAADSLSDFANNIKVLLQELDRLEKVNQKLKADLVIAKRELSELKAQTGAL